MKSIIITGATSFIGIHLINELLSKDIKIYAVVRPGTHKIGLLPRTAKVNLVIAGMDDYNKLRNYIKETCDCFVHLAWNGTRGADRMNSDLQAQNYEYAMDAINSSIHLGCRTFIGAGSQAEYGVYNYQISEETICHPNTEYGKQKLKFFEDASILSMHNDLHYKEPRFFSLYGPGDYEGTMVISTIKKMLRNDRCEFTESKQMWDYLYIADAVNGIIKLMDNDCADGAYNFGYGSSRTLKSYIEDIYRITGSKSEMLFGVIPYPKTGMVSIQPCIDKMKRETGWIPKTAFDKGIKNIMNSLLFEGEL